MEHEEHKEDSPSPRCAFVADFFIGPAHWIMIDASRPKFHSPAAVLWQDGAITDFSYSMRPLRNPWGIFG